MRQYERGGVVVDQCGECRGIFLDRGELDHLINAETQWSGSSAAPGVAPRHEERRYDRRSHDDDDHRYEQRSYSDDDHRYDQRSYSDDDHRHGQRPYNDKYRQKKKRKSFFEDLFDD
jgi:uncharacterized protein